MDAQFGSVQHSLLEIDAYGCLSHIQAAIESLTVYLIK